jgi:TRAP transporter TAXI family solute receptor
MKRYLIGVALAALVSSPAVAGETPNICTGDKSGKYFATGVDLVQRLGSQGIVNFGADPKRAVLVTDGSIDNLRRLVRGECQFAIVQKDALVAFGQYEPTAKLDVRRVVELYPEYVHFLCNKDHISGRVTTLLDNKGKNTVAIGEPGSGPHATWTALAKIEPRYNREKGPRTVEVGGIEALLEVEEGRIDCMVYIAGLNTKFIQEVNAAANGRVRLIDFDDRDFVKRGQVDGTPVYAAGVFPTSGHYKQITGWGSTNTITTAATLVVSQRWYEENRSKYNSMLGDLRRWLAERK